MSFRTGGFYDPPPCPPCPPLVEAGESAPVVIGDFEGDMASLAKADSLIFLVPRIQSPYFRDVGSLEIGDDWYKGSLPDASLITVMDESADAENFIWLTSIFGVANNAWHPGSAQDLTQITGAVTVRALMQMQVVGGGSLTFVMGACRGLAGNNVAADNVLYEVQITARDRILWRHERGTRDPCECTWLFPPQFNDDLYVTEIAGVRDTDGDVRMYVNGYRLHSVQSTTDGSEADGVFTPTAAPTGGTNGRYHLERDDGRPRGQIFELAEGARSEETLKDDFDKFRSAADPNIELAALTNAQILAALETGNELEFFIADPDAANDVIQRVGLGAGADWQDSATAARMLNNSAWGGWTANTDDWANDNAGYPAAMRGGSDLVYRMMFLFRETSFVARWFGNSTTSGAVNYGGQLNLTDAHTFRWIMQYGSKVTDRALFDAPDGEDLVEGQIYLLTVRQADNADGTHEISMWLNGQRLTCTSVETAAVNNGDSATVTDGTNNGSTRFHIMGDESSGVHRSYWRFLQIDQGTTDDAAEAAICEALGFPELAA